MSDGGQFPSVLRSCCWLPDSFCKRLLIGIMPYAYYRPVSVIERLISKRSFESHASVLDKRQKMKNTSLVQRATFFLLLLFSNFANAIGDSAGGCGGGGSPLEIAAIAGTPRELEAEIDRSIAQATDVAKRNRKLLSHPNWNKYSIWIAPETISQPIQNKRTIFINWWAGCEGVHLLEIAAASGNQDTAQYLLGAGANPNIGNYNDDTIFMRCANLGGDKKRLSVNGVPDPARTKTEADRKIAVYSQLLAKGGDLSRLNKQGLSALHLCKDPEAITLFLREPSPKDEGTSRPILDFRIERIVEDYYWERDANFSILRQLLPTIANKTLERETLWRICNQCSDPRKADTCNRLSKVIDVPDQDIFLTKDSGATDAAVHQKCKKHLVVPSPPVEIQRITP